MGDRAAAWMGESKSRMYLQKKNNPRTCFNQLDTVRIGKLYHLNKRMDEPFFLKNET
jgi:hypothetical protein